MNPILTEIFLTQAVTTENGVKLPLHSHLPEFEGNLLQQWLTLYKPTRLLEVGMAYGIASLFICEAVKAWPIRYYHIIDAYQSQEWQGVGLANLYKAGYKQQFLLHEQFSEICLPQLLQQELRFDFVYVDGWHTFDHVMMEFFYINRMLDEGGVVVFDDVHLPALQKVLACIDNYDCYSRLPIPQDILQSLQAKVRRMMGVPQARIAGYVKVAEDNRDWDWYKEF